MRYISALVVLLITISFCARDARAWNKPGHMLTGALAYHALKASDPMALRRVIRILREHPFYEERWKSMIAALPGNDPDKEGLFLFMHAARWPDDVRGDEDLHCGACHFVNFRFRPGEPPDPTPVSIGGNLLNAFAENRGKVSDNSREAEERAKALSWVFHLIGDAHQPLHAVALVTTDFPQGDRGGNLFFIRERANARTITLHKFWDDLVMSLERFRSVRSRADGLRARREFRRSALAELSEKEFERWANTESFSAAKQNVYRNGSLTVSTDEENGAVLPQDYAATARPIAERRVMLAGYRIADLLSSIF